MGALCRIGILCDRMIGGRRQHGTAALHLEEFMAIHPAPEGAISSSFNPYTPDQRLDPFPAFAKMRELGPIIWLEELGAWGVFRDELCREILNDADRFGSAGGGDLANYYREKPWREPSVVFEVDPPDHTRTRQVLSRILSPKAVRELDGVVQKEAKAAVSALVAKGSFDVVEDFTKPFALKIVPDAIGLAPDDRENLLTYNKYLVKGRSYGRHNPWTEEELEEADRVVKWVEKTCQRDSVTSDGFGAQIYQAHDGGQISEHEANMLIRSFLSAGTDTTFGTISNAIYFLLKNPDQMALLRANPELARAAYDEGTRYRSTALQVARNTRSEMDFHGTKLGLHDKIMVYTGAANRDPNRWEDPDEYRIERSVVGHLGFGAGIHGCVGQMIARMEGMHLIRELIEQSDSIELGSQLVEWTERGRAVSKLPVIVTPKS